MEAVSSGRGGRAGGVAVPLALVLVVALGLLGAGALALAQRQAATTSAAVVWTRGRVVARGVLREVVVSLSTDPAPPADPPWVPRILAAGSAQGVEYGVELRSLGREWRLVSAWARGSPATTRAEAATLAWSLDPLARVGATPAVLVHGGALSMAADAAVEGGALLTPGEGGSAVACASWSARLDSVFPSGGLPRTVRAPAAEPPVDLPALGLLGPGELRERLPGRVLGTVTPIPLEDAGTCRDGPDNWGSPTDPDGPCGERRVALLAPGNVALEGGEGQGLLLVEGSLTLTEGAVFAGLVVVRDTLRVGPGARIVGLARSGGPAILASGSLVDGRACPAVLALAAAPLLPGLVSAPGGAWIRPF